MFLNRIYCIIIIYIRVYINIIDIVDTQINIFHPPISFDCSDFMKDWIIDKRLKDRYITFLSIIILIVIYLRKY